MSYVYNTQITIKSSKKSPLTHPYYNNNLKDLPAKIYYFHPLGTLTIQTTKRIMRNEFGEKQSISLPYLRFLDKNT